MKQPDAVGHAPVAPTPDGCGCAHCFSLFEGKDIHWLKTALTELVFAAVLLAIGFIVRRFDPNSVVHSNNTYRWIFLVSIMIFVFVGGRVLDWIVFNLVSRLARVSLLSDLMFYLLSLDGVVQHLTWIIVGVRTATHECCVCRVRVCVTGGVGGGKGDRCHVRLRACATHVAHAAPLPPRSGPRSTRRTWVWSARAH